MPDLGGVARQIGLSVMLLLASVACYTPDVAAGYAQIGQFPVAQQAKLVNGAAVFAPPVEFSDNIHLLYLVWSFAFWCFSITLRL
jgi:hypothetical protein